MKTSIMIFFICSLFVDSIDAQYYPPNYVSMKKYDMLDSAYLKVTYKLVSNKDPKKPDSKHPDMQVLLIGKNKTKYYSQYAVDYNEKMEKLIKKGADAIPNNTKLGTCGYEIFKDPFSKKITVTDLGSRLIGNFKYEDDVSDLNWEMKDDTTTILSYSCQKATTKFRGRTYEAWFTNEIPINNGPWKFSGLPGLILKVSDLSGDFVFECIGMENLQKKEAIKFYKLEYTEISRKDLDKLYRRMHEDNAGYSAGHGVTSMEMDPVTKEFKVVKKSTIILPYNPIELE